MTTHMTNVAPTASGRPGRELASEAMPVAAAPLELEVRPDTGPELPAGLGDAYCVEEVRAVSSALNALHSAVSRLAAKLDALTLD